MQLEKIKLAGFKSFVDPTTIEFPSNLIGIVGPNGCGKSNLIDAVRWVTGESSAKQLRSESLAAVIFNGSVKRKPVGCASVELLFDNSDGTLGGEYAKYNQISIRREVDRDSQSTYYFNGTKCRRKDITDVFRGTGLSPRSYSIIEQGMISQVIEAKPEELRGYLEEAAGISKYKERRRETENRLKHTRENLNRITDLREELATQLEKLRRQARAAERYKVLKEEERLLKAQLLALRWYALDESLSNYNLVIGKRETLLESHNAELQRLEIDIENKRSQKTELNDEFNEIQSRYYQIGNEITRLEQSIEHHKERRQQLEEDLRETEASWQEAEFSLKADQKQIDELILKNNEIEPKLESAKSIVEQLVKSRAVAEEQMQIWQNEWDQFNSEAAKASEVAQVEQTHIQHLEQQQVQANLRLEKIDQEQQHVDLGDLQIELDSLDKIIAETQMICEKQQSDLEDVLNQITQQRNSNQQSDSDLHQLRDQLHDLHGRSASLEALQQAALGQTDDKMISWLENHDLKGKQRLANELSVQSGWETAVETVLGDYLEAICVDNIDKVAAVLNSLEHGSITLFDVNQTNEVPPSKNNLVPLSSKIQSQWSVNPLLNQVYIANSLSDALSLRPSLNSKESLITKEGIWIGKNWIKVSKKSDAKAGVIQREENLRKLKEEITEKENKLEVLEEKVNDGWDVLSKLEKMREQLQLTVSQAKEKHASTNAKYHVKKSQIEQIKQQQDRLATEVSEQKQYLEHSTQDLFEARERWQAAMEQMEKNATTREELLKRREACWQALEKAKSEVRENELTLHSLELEYQSGQTKLSSLKEAIERTQRQMNNLLEHREALSNTLENSDTPIDELKGSLQEKLSLRLDVEKSLNDSQEKLNAMEHEIKLLSGKRHQEEEAAQLARTELEAKRLESQELRVRKTTLQEQLAESTFELKQLLEEMPEEANEQVWNENVERVAIRISRLGPINLAAIEEFDQLSERKEYLDKQNADLEEALETLMSAIRKIDRETRQKFKETFDIVNNNFKALFPRVFGGGNAFLELTGEDLLDTGIALMAKPPGKHISSIHQLSGGEKALTALALVFAFFQLNPSPFCMLDEVDAPLDDANVIRFCELVKHMSETVQFIFISHNKVAIEMAKHLTGVTMHEPGVSRIVAVDIDAAFSMAE